MKKVWIVRSLQLLLFVFSVSLVSCSGQPPSATTFPRTTGTPTSAVSQLSSSPTTITVRMENCDQAVQFIQQGKVQSLIVFINVSTKTAEFAQLVLVGEQTRIEVYFVDPSCWTRLQNAVQQENQKLPADQQIQISQQQVTN